MLAHMDANESALLAEANVAFEAGNYQRVREICRKLENAKDPATARGAHDLLRRTRIDPAQVGVLMSCTLFFLWAIWRYV